jgi:hypothetical protein
MGFNAAWSMAVGGIIGGGMFLCSLSVSILRPLAQVSINVAKIWVGFEPILNHQFSSN